MLVKAQSYLCSLVVRFIRLTMDEAAKINGILVSIKCFRASQVGYCVKEVIIANWFVSKNAPFTLEGRTVPEWFLKGCIHTPN